MYFDIMALFRPHPVPRLICRAGLIGSSLAAAAETNLKSRALADFHLGDTATGTCHSLLLLEPKLLFSHVACASYFSPLITFAGWLPIRPAALGVRVEPKQLEDQIVVDGISVTRLMASILTAQASGERAARVSEGDTLRALRARGLIQYNRLNRPSRSIATVRGRQVIVLLTQLAHADAER